MTTPWMPLLELLRGSQQTLGFAESCTGGKLSSLLTEQAGVSDVFLGSVVSYSNQVKQDLLGVRSETLATFGAVSEQTAQEMALGAQKALKTDWAVSITGVAGPSGGTPQKPVGLVCFGVTGPLKNLRTATRNFSGSRVEIQRQAALFAVEFLAESVKEQQKRS